MPRVKSSSCTIPAHGSVTDINSAEAMEEQRSGRLKCGRDVASTLRRTC